jgi:hypothetical protein
MNTFEQMPYTNFHDLNLDWVLTTVKNLQTAFGNIEPIANVIKDYEKSVNISNNRKLSQKGDFTGSIFGLAANLLLSMVDLNTDQIRYLANQFSDGQTGLVIDGAYFENDGIHKNYNGGIF